MKTADRVHLTINRISYNDDGTPGHLSIGRNLFATLEPPWRDNAPSFSCIPPGTYNAEIGGAPSYPDEYLLDDVPGRAGIVIHWGNFAGDESLGFQSDTAGCILIGRAAVLLNKHHVSQRAVILSRSTLAGFKQAAKRAPLLLTINPPLSAGGTIWPEKKTTT